jgi:selenocysteine lyase/cysteine desulfurase
MADTLDLVSVRSKFPALSSGFVFADNAGGSQVAQVVIDKLSDYLSNTNVQLGADYGVSKESTSRVALGSVNAAKLFNASSPDEIVLGASSTLNLENLARGLEPDVQPGDEVIVTGEHEGVFSIANSNDIMIYCISQRWSMEEAGEATWTSCQVLACNTNFSKQFLLCLTQD